MGRGVRRGRAWLLFALLTGTVCGAGTAAWAQPAPGNEAVALRGLVLLDKPEAVRPAGRGEAPAGGLDLARVPVLATAETQALLAPYLGRPIDMGLVGEVRQALLRHLEKVHRPFTSVTVPEQDASDGTVQLLVVESRLGALTVEGARWFDAGQYRGAMRTLAGEPIDSAVLSDDIAWINRNSFRRATVAASPGAAVGTTDLVIRAEERFPLSVTAGIDNTGNRSSGLLRINAGLQWANAFWRGDDATYRYTTSKNFRALRQHSVSYGTSLPWRQSLTVSGSYSLSGSPADSLIGNKGVTGAAALRYVAPLPDWGALKHRISIGYDFRSTDNDILFGGVSVFPTTSEINQFVVDYGGQLDDTLGSTSVSLTLVGSPGGISANNTDAAFSSQQAGAKARYLYARLSVNRLTQLPAGLSLNNRLVAQISSAVLLPSEQLGFGGVQSVRGFLEQAQTRDQGVVIQNELRAPVLATGAVRWTGLQPDGDQLSAFVFLDAGFGRNRNEPAGSASSSISLISAGPGLAWQLSRHLSATVTWGLPILERHNPRGRLGVQFGVQLTI